MIEKRYPRALYEAAKEFSKKAVEYGCYSDDGKWKCPCFDYEMECDGDCHGFILGLMKMRWNNFGRYEL